MALNDFHRSDCKCARCYDPVLLRQKKIDQVAEKVMEEHSELFENLAKLEEQEKAKQESAIRKGKPLFSGCLMYFPDALLAVAEHSKKANEKHNPGQPLHWSKDKSKDHADCIARHLVDIGPSWDEKDPELDSFHATALAWRSLALLQTVLERKKAGK